MAFTAPIFKKLTVTIVLWTPPVPNFMQIGRKISKIQAKFHSSYNLE